MVDACQNAPKAGFFWLTTIVDAGFSGGVYLVNPHGGHLQGLKIYPSLSEIPGIVDYVIIYTTNGLVFSLLDDCAAKQVKAVHLVGSDLDKAQPSLGQAFQEELLRKARLGGFRIIGPNCLGIYCPESRIPYGPKGKVDKIGFVAFISQSSYIGERLIELGEARGIHYSKGISFGDGVDLSSTDFTEYMAADPKTSIIGVYVEDVGDPSTLLKTIRQVAQRKPLIIWKNTKPEDSTTDTSGTGFSANPATIWSAALKQAGAIEVHSLEELTDTLLIFQQIGRWHGNNVAIISGLADGGGGISVAASDACAELGLNVPPLSKETTGKLTGLLGQVGTILRNPVDIGQAFGSPAIIEKAIELVLADSSIDITLVQEDMGVLLKYLSWEQVQSINAVLVDLKNRHDKPMVVVLPPGSAEMRRLETERKLAEARIPVFHSMGQAARAIINLSHYSWNGNEPSQNIGK